VSMSLVLGGAKKFRVKAAFGGSLTVASVGNGLVYYLPVCQVSLEICLLRLFTSRKLSS
jgi:hypothetical protein